MIKLGVRKIFTPSTTNLFAVANVLVRIDNFMQL